MDCGYQSQWGPCKQPSRGGHCSYHVAFAGDGFREDKYYHRKVVEGTLEPAMNYITRSEMVALFAGRPRRDGRRLDLWTL